MREVSVEELKKDMSDLMGKVAHAKERIMVTKHGRQAVVLISVEDLELFELLEDYADVIAAEIALLEQGQKPLKSHAELKAELGLK